MGHFFASSRKSNSDTGEPLSVTSSPLTIRLFSFPSSNHRLSHNSRNIRTASLATCSAAVGANGLVLIS